MSAQPERVSIESLCLTVTSGGTPSRANPRFWEDGVIPWFKTAELKDWYVDDAEERITEEALSESSARVFPPDTVLMAMYGDGKTITSLGILRNEAATNQACCAMIVDPVKCNFLYLFYALKYHRHELLKLVVAWAQRNLSGGIILKFKILSRPLSVQVRIANILSAYDGLIENNRRRMALLEEAARQLYHEWFVRFRFPGHEHTRIINGVPEGWDRVPTPEAIDINPSTTLSDETDHWSVEMADLPTHSMVIQRASKRCGRSGSKFRNGDTLFARITPCLENGKTAFVDFLEEGEVARGSTEFIVLRSKRVTPEYVYCLARTYEFRENAVKSMVGSSGRQRVQESCFEKFFVLVPPQYAIDLVHRLCAPTIPTGQGTPQTESETQRRP